MIKLMISIRNWKKKITMNCTFNEVDNKISSNCDIVREEHESEARNPILHFFIFHAPQI